MVKEVLEKSKRLTGKAWIRAYHKADRLTQVAMLSHALWVHKIASINYGYLSYLRDFKFGQYLDLLREVEEVKTTTEQLVMNIHALNRLQNDLDEEIIK